MNHSPSVHHSNTRISSISSMIADWWIMHDDWTMNPWWMMNEWRTINGCWMNVDWCSDDEASQFSVHHSCRGQHRLMMHYWCTIAREWLNDDESQLCSHLCIHHSLINTNNESQSFVPHRPCRVQHQWLMHYWCMIAARWLNDDEYKLAIHPLIHH